MADRSPNGSATEAPPRSVTAVLCREVGAQHPDGALKQIRTMKRLLRSHYRVKQRLESYGVESLEEAVSHIATLTQRLERTRQRRREQAQRRLTVIEALLDKMEVLRGQETAPSGSDSPTASEQSSLPLQEALDLVDALSTELDELRLELWLHDSEDSGSQEEDASPGASAAEILERLDSVLQEAGQMVHRLRQDRTALREKNTRLQRKVERLQDTVDQQQARIDALEQPRTADRTPTDA